MNKQQEESMVRYAAAISEAISGVIEEHQDHINDHPDNLTVFFHAMANVAPTAIFNNIVGGNKNHIEFNHLANELCFQYGKKEN